MIDLLSNSRVLCAMSGGVDSSVTAYLLKQKGFQVIGAMMRFWPDDKKQDTFDSCCSPDAAYEARRVAEQVGVPFYLLDYREQFQKHIVGPFIEEYSQGRTPNPCVNCNTFVKFDELIKRAKMLGCRYVATGHYVKRIEDRGEIQFHRGDDVRKDQTYFLWGTPKDALPYILFPVGELEKTMVREIAQKQNLLTASKPESQNICFIPGKLQDFIAEHIPKKQGFIKEIKTNEIVGEHFGTQFYTLGQKKGLGLYKTHKTRFVVKLDTTTQTVWVGDYEDCLWLSLDACKVNYLTENIPNRISVQVRYRTKPVMATFINKDENNFSLKFDEPQFAVAPGQSAVLYDNSRLIGGGIIATI